MRLLMNVQYAMRQLSRSTGFTVAVVLILGFGTGVSTAIVSTVDHVLYRPLALPASEQLITICEKREASTDYCSVSPPNAYDWGEQARSIAAIGVARFRSIELHSEASRKAVAAAMVTPGFLEAAGVSPAVGRLLTEADMLPRGDGLAIVISHELWQQHFGGDPQILDRTVLISSGGDGRVLDRASATIIGIMPPGFDVPRFTGAQAWFPLQMDARGDDIRGWRGFTALARLQPGAGADEAQHELRGVQEALGRSYPTHIAGWRVETHRLREYVTADVRPVMMLFVGAVVLVLLILCINVLILLLARASRRGRELGVLVAVGATRGQLVQQLGFEALLLALLGGATGLILGSWLIAAIKRIAPPGIPRLDNIAVDMRVAVIMTGLTVALGLLLAVLPALRLRDGTMLSILRHGRSDTGDVTTQRWRRRLIAVQLSLAMALLLNAVLLARSFAQLAAFDPGFTIDHVVTFQVYPPQWKYDSREQRRDFYAQLTRRLESVAGVVAVGSASAAPLVPGGDGFTPLDIHGREFPTSSDMPAAEFFNAGSGFFPALGVPLLAGRNFDANASGDIVEAIVNRTLAREQWGTQSPVGARVTLPDWDMEAVIIGVVADVRAFGDGTAVRPAIYVNASQRPRGASFLVVRVGGSPHTMMAPLADAVTSVDADVDPRQMATMRDLLRERLMAPRFNVLLITGFAFLALVMSAAGLYALIAYTVSLRTHEFGIRLALGAKKSQLLTAVLLDGSRLLGTGTLLGLGLAWALGRLLRGFMGGVTATDGTSVAVSVAVLSVAVLAAALAPALRAARTDPLAALRE